MAARIDTNAIHKLASELMFAGEHVSAEEAVALGLANRVVAADELLPACKALADKIAHKSPLALKLLKRTLAAGADMTCKARSKVSR
jgi:enoyl-CoA hydratase